jgi:hypothetical protein
LFYAKQSEATVRAESRSRGLSSTPGGNRAARAVRRCSGIMGFGGLRFGLLACSSPALWSLLPSSSAVRFGRRAVKVCSLDVMWLRHEPMSSRKTAPQRALLNFLAETSVWRETRNLLRSRDQARRQIRLLDIRHPCVDSDSVTLRRDRLVTGDESVSFTTAINRRNCPRPVSLGVRWSRARGLQREVQVE